VDAASARPPSISDPMAAAPRWVPAPNSCSSQMVAKAPTDSCVSTVMITSGQCASAGTTCVTPRGLVFGGRLAGSVTRVVEMLPSPVGVPAGAAKASTAARH